MACAPQGNVTPQQNVTRPRPTSDPRSWVLFKHVDPELLSRMKLFYVFGKHGSSVFFVTCDDDVYGIGGNTHGILGVGAQCDPLSPKPVLGLRGQGIVQFASGDGHVLALCSGGKVFSWGSDAQHQLGNWQPGDGNVTSIGGSQHGGLPSSSRGNLPGGRRSSGFRHDSSQQSCNNMRSELGDELSNDCPCHHLVSSDGTRSLPCVVGSLRDEKVTAIAAGAAHSVAVTNRGEVYSWGRIYREDCGRSFAMVQPNLVLFDGYFAGFPRVRSAVCGASSTHCLTSEGQVYSFGDNEFRQLGSSRAAPSAVATFTVVSPRKVIQLAAGAAHCLALTDDGKVYSWGRSAEGQLGREAVVVHRSGDPDQVHGLGAVAEIAAIHSYHLSVVLTRSGHVFVWGMGMHVPTLTTFTSLQEAFSRYTWPTVTYQTMIALRPSSSTGAPAKSVRNLFDDAATADVKFRVEGRTIHAHRAILALLCEYFRNMFQEHWLEGSQDVVEIGDYSYDVYRAFLSFLYTDELHMAPADTLLSLMQLAHSVLEQELRNRCAALLKHCVTVANATAVYSAAVKFECEELEQFSLCFAAGHLPAVMASDGFRRLTDDELRNFVAGAVRE